MKDVFHAFLYIIVFFTFIGCLSLINDPKGTEVKANLIVQSMANIYHNVGKAFHQECK